MLELLQIVEQEASDAIRTAYQEGYKQGVLAWKPECEKWKLLYEDKNQQLLRLKNSVIGYTLASFAGGFLLGGTAGFSIGFKVRL